VGPQQGRKVFTLQTLPPDDDSPCGSDRVAREAGFSLHAGVSSEAHQRDKLERLCRYICRQLSLMLRYEGTDSHLLMVLLDTDMGQSMHRHSAERGDIRALRRGANELVNRLWKAYQFAVEQAEA
jgi:hypothetical protein